MLAVGIHDGVPMRDYLLHAGLSASRLNILLSESPLHARHSEGGEPSEASEIGTAIHDGLLEGVDRIVAIEADDWRTKAAKDARDEARAASKIPMLARKVAQVQAAIAAAKSFIETTELSGIFERGKPEQTVIWYEGKLICKARPDWLTDSRDVLLHVKTTDGSAEPNSWIRNQLVRGYDVAAAFYERGMFAVSETPEQSVYLHSVFLVIEQNAPYGCSLIGMSPAMQDIAASRVNRGISLWAKCKAAGKYPAYSPVIHYAEPFAWQMADEEEKQMFSNEELHGGIPL